MSNPIFSNSKVNKMFKKHRIQKIIIKKKDTLMEISKRRRPIPPLQIPLRGEQRGREVLGTPRIHNPKRELKTTFVGAPKNITQKEAQRELNRLKKRRNILDKSTSPLSHTERILGQKRSKSKSKSKKKGKKRSPLGLSALHKKRLRLEKELKELENNK